jgi:hypothetical protein
MDVQNKAKALVRILKSYRLKNQSTKHTMKNLTSTLYFGLLFSLSVFSQSTADYNISLTTIWNAADHTSVPGGAHWSALVGATHNTANQFVELGVVSPMTNGIKDIAETGATGNFSSEVTTAIGGGLADQYVVGFTGFSGPVGTFTKNNLQVNESFPLITLLSMVAPSPDWFIAVNSVNLRSGNSGINNGWKETFTIDVFAYDAGTDDGTNYTSPDAISNPRLGVFMLSNAPINGKKMGTITFTYNSSTLSISKVNLLKNIKIFPNPSKNVISISNIQNIHLKNVAIYNILGRLITEIYIEKSVSKLDIKLTNMAKGMYLLKLNTFDDNSLTRKLIVE